MSLKNKMIESLITYQFRHEFMRTKIFDTSKASRKWITSSTQYLSYFGACLDTNFASLCNLLPKAPYMEDFYYNWILSSLLIPIENYIKGSPHSL